MKRIVFVILSISMMINLCIIPVRGEENNLSSDYAVTQIIEQSMIDQTNKSGIYSDSEQSFMLFVSPSGAETLAPQQILVKDDKIMIRNSFTQGDVLSWGAWRVLNDTEKQNSNAIYVVCDGDHDELKIQAAIDNASPKAVIYPIGYCELTNDNVLETEKAVLYIKEGITLDGSYCDKMVFKNTSPSEGQIVFYMADSTTLRYIDFYEEACTKETINPSIVYNVYGAKTNIEYNKFTNIYDSFLLGCYRETFCLPNSRFAHNEINGWEMYYDLVKPISFSISNGICEQNSFDSLHADQYGRMWSINNSLFSGNSLSNCDFGGGRIEINGGGRTSGNVFKKVKNVDFDLNGNIINNTFISCSSSSTLINLHFESIFEGNTIRSSRTNGDELISMYNEVIISNNLFMRVVISPSTKCLIGVHGYGSIKGNIIEPQITSEGVHEDFNLIYSTFNDYVICKDNITSYPSIGLFEGKNNIISDNIVNAE